MSVIEEHGMILASVDAASSFELGALSAHERQVVGVVTQLRANVDPASITAMVRDGGGALECVREALEVLGELDPELLVRVALDALVCAHVDDRAAARGGSGSSG